MESRTGEPGILPNLDIFAYAPRQADDLFSLNARLGLRYDTLASLNGAASKDGFNGRRADPHPEPGRAFRERPSPRGPGGRWCSPRGWPPASARCAPGVPRRAVGARFILPRRVVFADRTRIFPAASSTATRSTRDAITSLYGWRNDPFTGSREFHAGLDIGAPDGPRCMRRATGRWKRSARANALGRYRGASRIPGGYQTVYGHLSAINVTIGERVSTGSILGAVGHTGRATGPHLHFEVRTKAGTRDPLQLHQDEIALKFTDMG